LEKRKVGLGAGKMMVFKDDLQEAAAVVDDVQERDEGLRLEEPRESEKMMVFNDASADGGGPPPEKKLKMTVFNDTVEMGMDVDVDADKAVAVTDAGSQAPLAPGALGKMMVFRDDGEQDSGSSVVDDGKMKVFRDPELDIPSVGGGELMSLGELQDVCVILVTPY